MGVSAHSVRFGQYHGLAQGVQGSRIFSGCKWLRGPVAQGTWPIGSKRMLKWVLHVVVLVGRYIAYFYNVLGLESGDKYPVCFLG